ncbi:MAG: NlpC/P60 family protein [Lentilactobacillus diolivorans]|uniref:NlpC/P60 family protein n=1 Tax=Lentilactobacillus diolivorans TaxID=179838 RepID=UPI0039E8EE6B
MIKQIKVWGLSLEVVAVFLGGHMVAHANTQNTTSFLETEDNKLWSGQSTVPSVSSNHLDKANRKAKAYQNPKRYYQVQSQQIKPFGHIGYTVKRHFEGIKTWLIMRKMGTYTGYNNYNQATFNVVKRFQRRHGLKVTGNVNEKTWLRMGFTKQSWTAIDSYVAPLRTSIWQGRQAHIQAMIKQAYRYLGNPYLVGSSSSPKYGTDCSGLVIQALYAGGINPAPISAIHHAYPGNEWNSRNLWASEKFKHVAYHHRQRGDLVFYYQPGTHVIWHVAIYLGKNKVIESWPPRIMIQPIKNGQRSDVAGIARPFN